MNVKDKIKEFFNVALSKITSLEALKQLKGAEKKERLDEYITVYLERALDTIGVNILVKWFIRKLIIENVPTITQCIFDLIKARVEGITEIITKNKA